MGSLFLHENELELTLFEPGAIKYKFQSEFHPDFHYTNYFLKAEGKLLDYKCSNHKKTN